MTYLVKCVLRGWDFNIVKKLLPVADEACDFVLLLFFLQLFFFPDLALNPHIVFFEPSGVFLKLFFKAKLVGAYPYSFVQFLCFHSCQFYFMVPYP